MMLFGYTDNKDLVEIDIPIGEIVAYEIDPWRLDLFDPNPVVYKAGETTINFRRLNNLAFTYSTDGKSVLGLHDGAHRVCVWTETCTTRSIGDVNWHKVTGYDTRMNPQGRGGARWRGAAHAFRQLRGESVLTNVRATDHSYERHLHQYLSALDEVRHKDFSPLSARAPHTSDRVTMNGSTFVFTEGPPSLELNPFINLAGQMFAERAIQFKTPPAVHWALHKFRRLNPTIVGKALLNALLGREVTHVEILLKRWPDQLEALQPSSRTSDSRLFDGSQGFDHEGCRFVISCKRPGWSASTWLSDCSVRFSVDQLYCERVGEIRGTRLAFFDIGRSCAQAVSQPALAHSYALLEGQSHSSGIVIPTEPAETTDERLFNEAQVQFADLGLRLVRRTTLLANT